MSGTSSTSASNSANKLQYTDFKGNHHNFVAKKDEIMLGYPPTITEGFLHDFYPGAETIAEEDTNDTQYNYARVDLIKPKSTDDMSFLGPKFSPAKYMPVMKESGRERYFLPASFILRIRKTSSNVIQQAESTGSVLGHKIIRKYRYKSNDLGEQVGDDEDSPLERKSDIINNNYGFYVVRLPASLSDEKPEETLFRILRENNGQQKPPDVEYAEVDEVIFKALRSYTPNDNQFGSQWGLKNTGAGTRTNVAWNTIENRGHQNVIIAVLDTGLLTTHVDFKYRAGETPAYLVINAYNVLDGTTNVSHTGTDANRYHGTWVAGVSSARVNNNDGGVAGAAWQCRMTPVKICTGSTVVASNAEAGVNYVIGKADEYPSRRYIILAGWQAPHTATFQAAIEDACNNWNIVVVAAAGDDNLNIRTNNRYPASYVVVQAGGALQAGGSRWGSSAFGTGVIMAPGMGIVSADGAGTTATITKDGTSYGAAFIAGAAGLVWGRDRNLHGSFTFLNTDVLDMIIANLAAPDPGYPNEGKLRTDSATTFP